MKLPLVSRIWTRPFFLFCSFAFLVSFFLPRQGFGTTLCGFYNLFEAPCFGCGMTRAMANLSRFNFTEAWHFHPFSFLLWPSMVVFGVFGLRQSWSLKLHNIIVRHDRILTRFFWAFLFAFLVFGLFRIFENEDWPGHEHINALRPIR